MTVLRTVIAVLMALVATGATAGAQSVETPSTMFGEANALYEGGDYEHAIGLYTQLAGLGVVDVELFYNMGNAYYKVGAIGHAVLNYERARRLAPRDDDIAANLSLTRLLLRDRQFIDESGWARRVLQWPHNNLSTRDTFILMSLWYVLLALAVLGFVLRDYAFVSRVYPTLSMASPGRLLGLEKSQDFVLAICTTLLLAGVTGISAHHKYGMETSRPEGVVLEEEVAVYSGPSDDSTLQFKIHEGTLVHISGGRPRWMQVVLPGGLSGWIRTDTVGRI